MKYVCVLICLVVVGVTLSLCGIRKEQTESEFLRIHIRANSDSVEDQRVKYMVRDEVVEALIPLLAHCETQAEAKKTVEMNFKLIEMVANDVLKENNKTYSSSTQIKNEYFPTRVYDGVTLESGNYDAVIVNLGSGSGENWWCVVYPAFCFLKSKNSQNDKYISKIWEIINKK